MQLAILWFSILMSMMVISIDSAFPAKELLKQLDDLFGDYDLENPTATVNPTPRPNPPVFPPLEENQYKTIIIPAITKPTTLPKRPTPSSYPGSPIPVGEVINSPTKFPVIPDAHRPTVRPTRPPTTFYPNPFPVQTNPPQQQVQLTLTDLSYRVEKLESLNELWRENFKTVRDNFRRLLRRVNNLSQA